MDAQQELSMYLVSEAFYHRVLAACFDPHLLLSLRYKSLCP